MRNNNKPTPVLNLALNKMVLIQLDDPVVVNQAAIRHTDKGSVFVISGEHYQELRNMTCMPDQDEGLTKAFILDRFQDNTYMELNILSDEAYEFIYNTLPTDVGVQQVLDQVYELLYDWHEDDCDEVLERLNMKADHLNTSEKQNLADELLSERGLEYYQKLDVDDELFFLYKGNLHEMQK